jgi:hypothetical protein
MQDNLPRTRRNSKIERKLIWQNPNRDRRRQQLPRLKYLTADHRRRKAEEKANPAMGWILALK